MKPIFTAFYKEKLQSYFKKSSLNKDEYSLVELLCQLLIDNPENTDTFMKLFLNEFNRRHFDINLEAAVAWADKVANDLSLYHGKIVIFLKKHYQHILTVELAKNSLTSKSCSTISTIATALDQLSSGQGQLLVANFHKEHFNFAEAFNCYLSVFSTCNRIDRKNIAGLELANLIYNGFVVLVNGKFDAASTNQLELFSENFRLSFQHAEETQLETMQKRAIVAYEYLQGNNSLEAEMLRSRLNSILSGNLTFKYQENTEAVWSTDALKEFYHYYKSKNLALLKEINQTRRVNLSDSACGMFGKAKISNEKELRDFSHSSFQNLKGSC